MNDFLIRLIGRWIFWLTGICTVAGLAFSIGSDKPWMAFFFLLPFTVALVDISYGFYQEKIYADEQRNSETELRRQAEQALSNFDSDTLAEIKAALGRANLEGVFDWIVCYAGYLKRQKNILNTGSVTFEVRRLARIGKDLYAIAVVNPNAIIHFKTEDPWRLTNVVHQVPHDIAIGVVHQINNVEQTVFVRIILKLDEPRVDYFEQFITEETHWPNGALVIKPTVEVANFQAMDMNSAVDALSFLRSVFDGPHQL